MTDDDEQLSDSEMLELLLDGAVEDVQRACNFKHHPLVRHLIEKPPDEAFEDDQGPDPTPTAHQ